MSTSYDYASESIGSTSSGLLDEIRVRDQAAWRRLVRLYGPLVVRWCRAEGLQDADIADVFQDVFRAVADKIDTFHHNQPGDSFRAWLHTITRNRIYDHYRRGTKEPRAQGGSETQDWFASQPGRLALSDGTTSQESSALYRRALQLLQSDFSDHVWRAFWRTTIDGVSPRDVAEELKMTPHAVRQAKSRVLRRLRDELREFPEGQ